MVSLPKIVADKPSTHNRKFRRALAVIGRTKLTGKQRWARVSDLVGKPVGRARSAGHHQLAAQFVIVLG